MRVAWVIAHTNKLVYDGKFKKKIALLIEFISANVIRFCFRKLIKKLGISFQQLN